MTKTRREPRIVIPITKVDVENRLVYGNMTSEAVDKANEIMDYETSKPYFEKWSTGIAKATDGVSLGNLRAMHQPIAAGKVTTMDFDDESKAIDICGKVVDDAEWNKVLEGVYSGFSIGGSYVGKKWRDEATGAMRYTVNPCEVSLVDNPCNPDAQFFQVVKADGSTEVRKFIHQETTAMKRKPTNEEVAARATKMASDAADGSDWTAHVEKATADLTAEMNPDDTDTPASAEPVEDAGASEDPAEPAAPAADATDSTDAPAAVEGDAAAKAAAEALQQVWQAPDGTTHAKKADAVAHVLGKTAEPEAPVDPVAAALAAAKAAGAEAGEEAPVAKASPFADIIAQLTQHTLALKAAHELHGETIVQKGLYSVSRLADLLQSLNYVVSDAAWERYYEEDGSVVPEQLAAGFAMLGGALVEMAQEEVAEVLASLVDGGLLVPEDSTVDGIVELAAVAEVVKADGGALSKRAPVEPAPVPASDVVAKLAPAVGLEESAEIDAVVSAILGKVQEATALKGQVDQAVSGIAELGETIKSLRGEMAALKNSPAPRPELAAGTTAVDKAAGGGGSTEGSRLIEEMRKTTEGQRVLAEAAIRVSQEQGQTNR